MNKLRCGHGQTLWYILEKSGTPQAELEYKEHLETCESCQEWEEYTKIGIGGAGETKPLIIYTHGGGAGGFLGGGLWTGGESYPECCNHCKMESQITRLNDWLSENEPDIYHEPDTDTATAILSVIRKYKGEN